MQRWAAGAPSPDVAIPAEPIRCLGRVLWGKQKRGLDSVWVSVAATDRTSLSPEATESHTHLAHAVVRYLGLTAPEELVPFGINNAAGIVDLISRVTPTFFGSSEPGSILSRLTFFHLSRSLQQIPSRLPRHR